MPHICDKGQDGFYFPSKGRRSEDFFFALKSPKALAGFEPANLGIKGQHSTSRPRKLKESLVFIGNSKGVHGTIKAKNL
jgi:hypothetical protein